jgi:arylsulfatase A-like enzyme
MPTNIVFIITDNQSPWTLGCYGKSDIQTPNIDRLSDEGMRFLRASAVNPVCSPNRATYLTGLIPSQHGIHSWLGSEEPDAQIGSGAYCTIEEFTNLPLILSNAGYNCGMSGKWHLGDSLHLQLGFNYWFAKPYGHTDTFYDAEAIWQGEVYREPRYYTDAITDHAVDFLRSTVDDEEPFFLYVGYNGPYGLGRDIHEGHLNRWTDYYADKELASFPREATHPWLNKFRDIINTDGARRAYAAAVSGVDDGVGTIMNVLDELGVADDTLVIFTADHGLCAGHHGMWGMGDHSRPMHMFEENLHVPLVIRHPCRIPSATTWDGMNCTYDFFPSLLEYIDRIKDFPENVNLPGRSYAGILCDDPQNTALEWNDETFHEYEDTRAIRTREWKYVRRFPNGPDELYNLSNDPGERQNLTGTSANTDIEGELQKRLDGFFNRYTDPRYDLWQGGESKAGRQIPELEEITRHEL